mmetsp:Transcript_28819/g.82743  ORF Transcript_28819/g.82743 Transcript_28819/m.82743 type:complete len:215 (+) Transcript_28819:265-909(+)
MWVTPDILLRKLHCAQLEVDTNSPAQAGAVKVRGPRRWLTITDHQEGAAMLQDPRDLREVGWNQGREVVHAEESVQEALVNHGVKAASPPTRVRRIHDGPCHARAALIPGCHAFYDNRRDVDVGNAVIADVIHLLWQTAASATWVQNCCPMVSFGHLLHQVIDILRAIALQPLIWLCLGRIEVIPITSPVRVSEVVLSPERAVVGEARRSQCAN